MIQNNPLLAQKLLALEAPKIEKTKESEDAKKEGAKNDDVEMKDDNDPSENQNSNTNSSLSNSVRENGSGMSDMLGSGLFNSLLTSHPQMRQLMEQNPEISHILNNPSALRETMEMATNPKMMLELMHHQDRVIANIESMPGGFNALQRMYRVIQEPMLKATQDQFGSNPFQTLSSSDVNTRHPTGENVAPLPIPWSQSNTNSSSTRTPERNNTGSNSGMDSGIFGSGMESLMQQMLGNSEAMQGILNSPATQSMLRNLSENPDLVSNMIQNNPLLAQKLLALEAPKIEKTKESEDAKKEGAKDDDVEILNHSRKHKRKKKNKRGA